MTHPERHKPGPKPPPDCPHCDKPKSATLYNPREWFHDQQVCSEECGKAWRNSSKRWRMELETCQSAMASLEEREIECRRELQAALERENSDAPSEQGSVVAHPDQDARETHSAGDGVVEAVRHAASETESVQGTNE